MDDIRLPYGVVVPGRELEITAAKGGGPGGQSVNTTDSKVELRWDVAGSSALSTEQRKRVMERLGPRLTGQGVLRLVGSEHRSQHRNRQAVLARFEALVGEALEPPRQRRRTRPGRGAKQRRLEAKRRRSEIKRLRKPPPP
ncbi:MAG: alternative ribosome rescue aminoacyl-tRNA hydrolase ArfB [Nitriliruptoraceae bacterium]